jgi:hypothetical protein
MLVPPLRRETLVARDIDAVSLYEGISFVAQRVLGENSEWQRRRRRESEKEEWSSRQTR